MKVEDINKKEIMLKIREIIFESKLFDFNWSCENKFFLELKANEAISDIEKSIDSIIEEHIDLEINVLSNSIIIKLNKQSKENHYDIKRFMDYSGNTSIYYQGCEHFENEKKKI
jgi:hypothetical protein